MQAPHWIIRVMNCISDDRWWDGLVLGLATAVAVGLVTWSWWEWLSR